MAASRKSKGPIIIEGYLPIEELDRGLPHIKQKRTGEHTVILVRKTPYKLMRWSKLAVHVRITIERVKDDGLSTKKNADRLPKIHRRNISPSAS